MADDDDSNDPQRELGELAAALRAHARRRSHLGRGREFVSKRTPGFAAGATQPALGANPSARPTPSGAPAPPRARSVPPPPRAPAPAPMLLPTPSERLAAPAPPSMTPTMIPAMTSVSLAGAPIGASQAPESDTRARASACADLAELRRSVAQCRACRLCERRTNTVFGEGNPNARVMFIGEAPGEQEDQRGEPFVGAAGELLTKIIESGMGLARADVYIANVIKCRPPGNRDPAEDEKRQCTPYLTRQIEWVDPEVIIPLGRHAANFILGFEGAASRSMGSLRDRVHELGRRKVIPTYHPSYLLRTPEDKKLVWSDIQRAMKILGLEKPSARK